MTLPLAVIGEQALYLLFIWLASAIIASYLSNRKGYGERPGLASGLILPVVSVIAWLVWPARADSDWKVLGPVRRQKADATVVAERESAGGPGPTGTAG